MTYNAYDKKEIMDIVLEDFDNLTYDIADYILHGSEPSCDAILSPKTIDELFRLRRNLLLPSKEGNALVEFRRLGPDEQQRFKEVDAKIEARIFPQVQQRQEELQQAEISEINDEIKDIMQKRLTAINNEGTRSFIGHKARLMAITDELSYIEENYKENKEVIDIKKVEEGVKEQHRGDKKYLTSFKKGTKDESTKGFGKASQYDLMVENIDRVAHRHKGGL